MAKELVDLRPNAILGSTTPVVGALARETKTISIVFTSVSDPIGGASIDLTESEPLCREPGKVIM